MELTPRFHLALDIIKFAVVNTSSEILQESEIQEKLAQSLSSLSSLFQDASENALILQTLYEILLFLPRHVGRLL